MRNIKTIENFKNRGYLIYQVEEINMMLDAHKYVLAEKMIYELEKKYPDDYGVIRCHATLLFRLGYYEEALKYFDMDEEEYVYVSKAIIYIFLKDYENLRRMYDLYFYNDSSMMVNGAFYFNLKYYIMRLLNIPIDNDLLLTYSTFQSYHYDRDLAIRHVKINHTVDGRDDKTFFNNDINIDELFSDIEKAIDENRDKYHLSYGNAIYFFHYLNVSLPEREHCDYIKVICNLDTNEIITMFPISKIEFPAIELNIEEKKENDVKVKRLSQIDKFNKKYDN